ncbi:MAG: helix-turn-helix transcriptional regulator [Burkholderiales bacterium]
MRRHVLLYGLIGGLMVAALRFVEYRWLVVEHSLELYGGIVAALFSALGIWLGLRLTRRTDIAIAPESASTTSAAATASGAPFTRDQMRVAALGITPRELEMLELVATGLSNKEIAAREFVSENTVKTHLSRVFDKIGAKRRTQAVQLAKQMRLIA